MGRTIPSYTQMLEALLKKLKTMEVYLNAEDRKALRRVVAVARKFQGPLLFDEFPDIHQIIVIASLIDIYRRLERIEECLLKDGY